MAALRRRHGLARGAQPVRDPHHRHARRHWPWRPTAPSRSTTSGPSWCPAAPRCTARASAAASSRSSAGPAGPGGVLGVHSTRPAAFDAEATAYVDQVAEVISSAVQRAEAEEQAREQTLYDRLTGLPGRELLLRRLDDAQAEARAHDRRLGLLLIDLDDLRLVNEGYGHEAGDEVLRVVARRVHDLAADGVAGAGHLAGDEFVVLFWETATDEQVFAAAEDVLAAVREPIVIADERLVTTASASASRSPAPRSARAEVLLREADVALRAGQAAGPRRGSRSTTTSPTGARSSACACRSTCASPSSRTSCTSSTSRSSASDDGRVCRRRGAPALAAPHARLHPPRRLHPRRRGQRPDRRRSALHVLRTACRAGRRLAPPAGTPVPVSVNVAVQQLARRGFAGDVQDALYGTGLAPSLLALEITETTLMEANDKVLLEELRAVRDLGVSVHLDDFGDGISSLGYLPATLPLGVVKVDRSFVSSLGDRPAQRADPPGHHHGRPDRTLGLRVVAEGIETAAQRDLVAQLGCDEAQGYLFAPPAPREAVTALLNASSEPVAG